jgi:hypothetical protein
MDEGVWSPRKSDPRATIHAKSLASGWAGEPVRLESAKAVSCLLSGWMKEIQRMHCPLGSSGHGVFETLSPPFSIPDPETGFALRLLRVKEN